MLRPRPMRSVHVAFALCACALILWGCREDRSGTPRSAGAAAIASATPAPAPGRRYKILHVMSYHAPWHWTDDQLRGFQEALEGVDVEYRVFQLDAKRQSSDAWKESAGAEARALIDNWQPDLVYTSDDVAQEYVTRHYRNSDIPFVFSAVNEQPSVYGFDEASNVAGVLEREHFVASIRLLQQLVPDVRRVAVLFDDEPIWRQVRMRMEAQLDELPDVEFVGWHTVQTFAEYKALVKRYEREADALLNVSIFTFRDDQGRNVDYREVLEWTATNSTLPDCSFWLDRVSYGTLCAVTVAAYEQGAAAGRIARSILVDGVKPADIPMKTTIKGAPVISLPRARNLNVQLDSSALLSARIIQQYEWER